MNGISSQLPYPNYPYNAVGATSTTKDIASTCFDAQRPYVAKTYEFLTTDDQPSYKWPVIGTVVSAISLLTIIAMKRRGH